MAHAPRPHKRASIVELERVVGQAGVDDAALHEVSAELRHRSTDRAARLSDRVHGLMADKGRRADDPPLAGPRPARAPGRPPKSRGASADPSEPPARPRADTTPRVDLDPRVASPGRTPPGGVEALLSCWTAYEALTPQTYRRESDLAAGDSRRVVRTDRGALPWPSGRSIPNHQLFYQVPLGAIPMGPATDALVRAFGEPLEAPSRAQEKALIAVVLVDRDGVPLAEDAVAVSSFAWALPHALAGRLDRLGAWTRVEAALLDALRDALLRHDEEGRALPLDAERLDAAQRWLVAQLGLPDGLAEPCGFALRVLHRFKSTTPPETPLLNSFFLRDLSRAAEHVRAGTAPTGLRAYLGMDRPKNVRDLLASEAAREEAVAPRRIPPARWPAPGGHPLVLLQQAAVNLARDEADEVGMFAVNGPPGTGKTTLLRDIVAGSVLDRARAMAAFDDPERAFTPSGENLGFGGSAFLHLHRLDPSLKGHEIVVASSNNNAVENVSRELPRTSTMGRDAATVGYLRTLSDALGARPNGSEGAAGEGTWGLVAAVLGKATNRAAFAGTFWWDKEVGLKAYLDAVRGRDTTIEEQGEDGCRVRRQPRIVAAEAPPTPAEAKRNWASARRRFAELLRDVDAELAEIEEVRQAGLEVGRCEEAAKAAADRLSDLQRAEQGLATALRERQEAEAGGAGDPRRRGAKAVRRTTRPDPGVLARLFRVRLARAWTQERSRARRRGVRGRARPGDGGGAHARGDGGRPVGCGGDPPGRAGGGRGPGAGEGASADRRPGEDEARETAWWMRPSSPAGTRPGTPPRLGCPTRCTASARRCSWRPWPCTGRSSTWRRRR